jgi:hypothetical protein
MTRAHRKDGFIRVVQEKTDTELWIHEHKAVAAELASDTHVVRLRLLTKASGGEFDADTLSPWFADAIKREVYPTSVYCTGCLRQRQRGLPKAVAASTRSQRSRAKVSR